jgi:hypothetical protein
MVIKAVLCSVVLVLVTGSGAFGNILQDQGFGVGSTNTIHLTQGVQNASSMQNLTIDLSQVADGSRLTMANVNVMGTSTQLGGLLGTTSLGASAMLGSAGLGIHPMLGTTSLGIHPMLGTTSLMMPFGASSSLGQAMLLNQLLSAH